MSRAATQDRLPDAEKNGADGQCLNDHIGDDANHQACLRFSGLTQDEVFRRRFHGGHASSVSSACPKVTKFFTFVPLPSA